GIADSLLWRNDVYPYFPASRPGTLELILPVAQANGTTALLFRVFRKDANIGQVTIAFRVVQPIADHELVRDLKADVVGLHRHQTARRLVEQRRQLQGARLARLQELLEEGESKAGIEDVLHQDHVLIF